MQQLRPFFHWWEPHWTHSRKNSCLTDIRYSIFNLVNKIEVITKVKKKHIHRKAINVRAIYMPVIVAKLIWNVVNMRRCKKATRFAQNANRMEWKNEYAIMGIDTGNIMWCARCRRNMVCSYASLRSNWATLNIIYVRVECGEWTEKILQKKIDYEPNNHNQTVF